MDSSEAIKVVIDRIQSMEPEHIAKKIIGYLYFQGLSDQEMIRLALGPDTLIHNLIHKAKTVRLLASSPVVSPPISPTLNPPPPLSDPSFQYAPFPSLSPRPLRRAEPYWDPQLPIEQPTMPSPPLKLIPYSDYIGLEDPLDAVNTGALSFPNDYYFPESVFNSLSVRGVRNSEQPTMECAPLKLMPYSDYIGLEDPLDAANTGASSFLETVFNNLSVRGVRNSSNNMMDFPRTCHYFIKGFCKHGSNCKYLHGESYPHSLSPNSYDVGGEEGFSPGSLEKLESEITELLKSRKGHPVSIASLPMLYYEKYGRILQAEGYLTESQRHGKAGYSLTKLLARLKNSIRLIDRPHGQHAVILSEDAAKYTDIRAERNDPGPIVSGSRQIYLTFPAESTFTEEDVSNHFSNFGPVHDVRIPCQTKRMFGFVTFVTADTVKLILSKGNPHYVCGARVLVKPYRDKAKLVERKYLETCDNPAVVQSHSTDMEPELQTCRDSTWPYARKLVEKKEHAIEHEETRLAQLHLAGRPSFGYSADELQLLEGRPKFSTKERFSYLFDALSNGSTGDDNRSKYAVNNCGDQESAQGVSLPDSPFASAVGSSISAVI